MIRDEVMEKLSPLWENEEFVKAMAAAETDEDVIKLFADNGISVTEEEVAEVRASAATMGELDEEDLEEVSGGFIMAAFTAATALAIGWWFYLRWIKWRRSRHW